MDEDVFFAKTEKTPGYILAHIIFNLIADDRLDVNFTVEKLVKLLQTPSLTPQDGTIFNIYKTIYTTKFKDEPDLLAQIDNCTDAINRVS